MGETTAREVNRMRAISFQHFSIKSDASYDSGTHTSIEPALRFAHR